MLHSIWHFVNYLLNGYITASSFYQGGAVPLPFQMGSEEGLSHKPQRGCINGFSCLPLCFSDLLQAAEFGEWCANRPGPQFLAPVLWYRPLPEGEATKSSLSHRLQESVSLSFKVFGGWPTSVIFNKSSVYVLLLGKLHVEPLLISATHCWLLDVGREILQCVCWWLLLAREGDKVIAW